MNQPPDPAQERQAMERFAAVMGESIANIRDMLAPLAKAFQDMGRLPDTGPTDPRERALWAKQQRGTGPAAPRDWGKR